MTGWPASPDTIVRDVALPRSLAHSGAGNITACSRPLIRSFTRGDPPLIIQRWIRQYRPLRFKVFRAQLFPGEVCCNRSLTAFGFGEMRPGVRTAPGQIRSRCRSWSDLPTIYSRFLWTRVALQHIQGNTIGWGLCARNPERLIVDIIIFACKDIPRSSHDPWGDGASPLPPWTCATCHSRHVANGRIQVAGWPRTYSPAREIPPPRPLPLLRSPAVERGPYGFSYPRLRLFLALHSPDALHVGIVIPAQIPLQILRRIVDHIRLRIDIFRTAG